MDSGTDSVTDQAEPTVRVSLSAVNADGRHERDDAIAVEEPMEIRVVHGSERRARSVSVTMRTPGHDFELAVGFLYSEGMIGGREQIQAIHFCGPPPPGKPQSNIVRVELEPAVELDLVKLQRNFYSTSSCGICGKASLEALDFEGYRKLEEGRPQVAVDVVHGLPDQLRQAQDVFEATGGLHAAGLFRANGELVASREDVGRHNAVDKLLGAQVLAGRGTLSDEILVVSGRVSFEIMQKALASGLPMIVAVGAPSSLAVEMAERFSMTLVGFARDGRFNVYTGGERVVDG